MANAVMNGATVNIEGSAQRGDLDYLQLGIAERRFGCAPTQLDDAQRYEVERIARRQAVIHERILASEEARQIVVGGAQVDEALERLLARYGDESEFERELSTNGLDRVQLRAALARELRVDAVLEYVAARVEPVDETEARLYYYLHTDQFQQPEMRTVRHVLITINPEFAENRREVALQRAREIARRLQRKPDRFAEQAMKHSECPTALQGGLIGNVTRGKLYPELDSELFAMREGAVSDVLESPIGFHVLFCEQVQREGVAPLNKVLATLTEQLTAQKAVRAQKQWIERLINPAQ